MNLSPDLSLIVTVGFFFGIIMSECTKDPRDCPENEGHGCHCPPVKDVPDTYKAITDKCAIALAEAGDRITPILQELAIEDSTFEVQGNKCIVTVKPI